MSLWWCPSCKEMRGGSNATCTCPQCGTSLEYATVKSSPESSTTMTSGAMFQLGPLPTGKTCWCQNLYDAGMARNNKCEPCIRRELAELKEQYALLKEHYDALLASHEKAENV